MTFRKLLYACDSGRVSLRLLRSQNPPRATSWGSTPPAPIKSNFSYNNCSHIESDLATLRFLKESLNWLSFAVQPLAGSNAQQLQSDESEANAVQLLTSMLAQRIFRGKSRTLQCCDTSAKAVGLKAGSASANYTSQETLKVLEKSSPDYPGHRKIESVRTMLELFQRANQPRPSHY